MDKRANGLSDLSAVFPAQKTMVLSRETTFVEAYAVQYSTVK